jgi:hypothetical protein
MGQGTKGKTSAATKDAAGAAASDDFKVMRMVKQQGVEMHLQLQAVHKGSTNMSSTQNGNHVASSCGSTAAFATCTSKHQHGPLICVYAV